MYAREQLPVIIGLGVKTMKGDARCFVSRRVGDDLTKPVTTVISRGCMENGSTTTIVNNNNKPFRYL